MEKSWDYSLVQVSKSYRSLYCWIETRTDKYPFEWGKSIKVSNVKNQKAVRRTLVLHTEDRAGRIDRCNSGRMKKLPDPKLILNIWFTFLTKGSFSRCAKYTPFISPSCLVSCILFLNLQEFIRVFHNLWLWFPAICVIYWNLYFCNEKKFY